MSKRRNKSMTELLREALAEADSLAAVERATGVSRQSIMKFISGTSLRLDIADRLAEHFGIECRAKTPRRNRRTKT